MLAYGSPTSHAAILARSRGIPAVVAAGPGVLGLAEGTTVVIDGATGELVVDPPAATLDARSASGRANWRRDATSTAPQPANPPSPSTARRIEVAANLGSLRRRPRGRC